MSLIHNASFDSQTRVLSLLDKAGNVISSCEVPSKELVDDPNKPLMLRSLENASSVTLNKNGTLSNTYQTSTNGKDWTDYTLGTQISLNKGKSVYFRCNKHPTTQSRSNYVRFEMAGKIEAWHNAYSMISSSFTNTGASVGNYGMYRLFNDCTSLTKAPLLLNALSEGCYYSMFSGCTSLTKSPELPAKKLVQYCYYYMFSDCSKLNEVRITATKTTSSALYGWLSGVAATGDFYCDPNTDFTYVGIPSNWNRWVYGAEDTGTTTTMYHNGASETVRVGTSSYGACYALQGWVGFRPLAVMHALGYTFGEQTVVTLYEDEHPMSVYACDVNDDDGFTETMYDIGDGDGYLTIERQNEKRYYVTPTPFTGLVLKAVNNASVTLKGNGNTPGTYRVDTGSGWRDYTLGTSIYLSAGRSCRWDCSKRYYTSSSSDCVQFVMNGTFEAYGNCLSLLSKNFKNMSKMSSYAFSNLFNNCTGLIKAPELPAMTLSEQCYYYMFYKCSSLKKAPVLPATSLHNSSYDSMFFDCTSLNEVHVAATSGLYNANFFLLNVSSTGDFYCDPNASWESGRNGIPVGWERWVYGAEDTGTTTTMYHNGTTETVKVGTSSYGACYALQGWVGFKTLAEMPAFGYTLGAQTPLTMYHHDTPVSAYSCEANAEDGFTETMYDVGNGKGYLTIAQQNANGFYLVSTPYTGLTLTATADNSSVKLTKNGTLSNAYEVDTVNGWEAYTFGTVINLNAGQSCKWRCSAHPTTQSDSNYISFVMTGTIEASGNINSMLDGKNFGSMVSLSGYDYAFYNMFQKCTSLTQAPALPATTLSAYCYARMFSYCTSLTQVPVLPATTLADSCYWSLFQDCGLLTKAPELPATELVIDCYYTMFQGCRSLKEVRVSATTTTPRALTSWLYNVSSTGDFYCDPNTDIFPTDSESGIPANWTRHALADYPVTP